MSAIAKQVRSSAGALSGAFRNRNIRCLQIAWLCFWGADTGCLVALGVFAFDVGGAASVGLLGLVRTLPAALLAPALSGLLDRGSRERVMVGALLGRVVLIGVVAAALFNGWQPWVVYLLAAIDATISTTYWPAQNSLIPRLARSPEEMTAANVATSTVEGIARLVGPALAAVILVVATTPWVFVAAVAGLLLAASAALRIHTPRDDGASPSYGDNGLRLGIIHSTAAGLRALAGDRHARLVVGLSGGLNFVRGVVATLVVVVALSLFRLGDRGVGLLISAIGAGALIGAFGSLLLVGRRAMAVPLGLSLAVSGVMLLGFGMSPWVAVGLLFLFLYGVASPVADVTTITLLQRLVPDEVLGRVFGVVEALYWGPFGIGAIAAAGLVRWMGIRWALGAIGLLLPLVTLVFLPALRRIDLAVEVPERQIALLRAIPLFSPLPAQVVEPLARHLVPLTVAAGETVVRQGDTGDRFYVIDDGALDVYVDGAFARTIGRGDHFGEIALLRDAPRTATVTAKTDAELYTLERGEFMSAVTGNLRSRTAAHEIADIRLSEHRPGGVA